MTTETVVMGIVCLLIYFTGVTQAIKKIFESKIPGLDSTTWYGYIWSDLKKSPIPVIIGYLILGLGGWLSVIYLHFEKE